MRTRITKQPWEKNAPRKGNDPFLDEDDPFCNVSGVTEADRKPKGESEDPFDNICGGRVLSIRHLRDFVKRTSPEEVERLSKLE